METDSQNQAPIVPQDLSRGPMPSKGAILALVVSNSVPLFGAIFWNWDIVSILILYWLENLVIGFYTILKIATAQGVPQQPLYYNVSGKIKESKSRSIYSLFFFLHYGIFTAVHGLLVFFTVIPLFGQGHISLWEISPALLGLFISHGISYRNNFIQKGEYLTASPDRQMIAPYKRVIIMHMTVLIGGFLAVGANTVNLIADRPIINAALPALVILVFIKIVVDLASHLYEHNAFPAGLIVFSAKGGGIRGGIAGKGWKR